ncbi:MAG: hypothetical protein J5715_06695 [Clostridiales bacterium]|nr:hypothetical protein [Clostridiales bacterium]
MNNLSIQIPVEAIRSIVREEIAAQKAAEEAELMKAREPRQHMRIGKYSCYPRLRRLYTKEELGRVINKGRAGVDSRLHGKVPFSEKEKELILKDLGEEVNAVNKRKYFDIGRKEKIS